MSSTTQRNLETAPSTTGSSASAFLDLTKLIEDGSEVVAEAGGDLPELQEEVAAAKNNADDGRAVEDLADLTLGERIRLIQPNDRWSRLGWALDRSIADSNLDRVRRLRNEIMRFVSRSPGSSRPRLLAGWARCLEQLLP